MSRPAVKSAPIPQEEANRFKAFLAQFIDALRPIVRASTGSDMELMLAGTYLKTQTAQFIIKTYKAKMETIVEGKLVWHWVAQKNDQLLIQHPELLLGFDNDKVKQLTALWISNLNTEQKATVWQWVHGMLTIAGYDIGEAFD